MLEADVVAEAGLAEAHAAAIRTRERRVLDEVEAVQADAVVELLVLSRQNALHRVRAQMAVSGRLLLLLLLLCGIDGRW